VLCLACGLHRSFFREVSDCISITFRDDPKAADGPLGLASIDNWGSS
jgi:hypothetical protein